MKGDGHNTDRIIVRVNGNPVEIYRGLKVKHALIACDEELYRAAAKGDIFVRDGNGYLLDLEGALQDGSEIIAGT